MRPTSTPPCGAGLNAIRASTSTSPRPPGSTWSSACSPISPVVVCVGDSFAVSPNSNQRSDATLTVRWQTGLALNLCTSVWCRSRRESMAMGRLSNRLTAPRSGSRLAVDLAPRHAFYDWCNEVLAEAEFDEAVEMLCQPHYKDGVGRPSIPPGRYFRMLFVGQFEGLDSEREIAWRCADSLSLHRFLRLSDGETVPDHSTLSVTRLPLEIHHAVFGLLLEIANKHDLVRAKRIGVDASTQDAALRRLVRRDTGEDYQEMLRRLAKESGIETPSAEDPLRPDPQGQDPVERRLGIASRRPHRPDEGRHHASGLQARARRRSRHRRDRGDPSGRSGRHPHAGRHAGTSHA